MHCTNRISRLAPLSLLAATVAALGCTQGTTSARSSRDVTTAPVPAPTLAETPGGVSAPPPGHVSLATALRVVGNGSYLSPLIEIFGDVSVSSGVFIASNTILRADPGTRICIGRATNLQDNILLFALRNVPVPTVTDSPCSLRSSSLGERVSIAHQATIRNSHIGDFSFVGFGAFLENAVLEEGAFVLHGADVRNVRIAKGRIVPVGAVITRQEDADSLPLKTAAESSFQEDVLAVNKELASEYAALYEAGGYDIVTKVGPSPRTSFNPGVWPTLAGNVTLREFARIVGDVRIGAGSVVGRRSSIRADEGAPIIIGESAVIRDRVTFHALKGTRIDIGNRLETEANIVFHGPLRVGDGLTVRDDAIVYDARIGNNVRIGTGAIVIGVTIRDGVSVPDGAIVRTQAQADALRPAGR